MEIKRGREGAFGAKADDGELEGFIRVSVLSVPPSGSLPFFSPFLQKYKPIPVSLSYPSVFLHP